MNYLKKLLSTALCLMMLFAMVPAALAEDTEPAAPAEEPADVELLAEPIASETAAGEGAEEPSEPAPEADAPVCVRFYCTPETAAVAVYRLTLEPSEQPDEPIAPEPDGSYLLLPGEYLYCASAEGFEPLEGCSLFVQRSEEAMQIEVALTAAPDAEPAPEPEQPEAAAVEPEQSEAPERTPQPEPAQPETTPEPQSERVTSERTVRPERPATVLIEKDAQDSAPETLDAGESAPEGFTIPAPGNPHKANAQQKLAAAGTELTFSLKNGVTATLKDGVMTVSGTGDVIGYNHAEDCPWYEYRDQIRQVVFEDGLLGIGPRLFWYCENLESIRFPETVTYVSSTFLGCTALKSVAIPASATRIDGGAFCDCTALETVTASGVESIGEYAFQNTGIRRFTLPKTLTNLEPLAFWKGAIEAFEVEQGNEKYTAKGGILYTDEGRTLACYPAGNTAASVKIPNGVTTVGTCAFASNPYMKSIDLNGVRKIEYSAFTSCTALESIAFPDSVAEHGACAFENCTALQSVRFGSGSKTTGYRTFASCKALTSIDFGPTLEVIGGLCFAYCFGLKNITLPASIRKVENGCFGECTGLVSFTTTSLTVIPYQMLLNDVKLTSVNLNSGITEINRYSIYGCRSLKTVTVPESVTFVADCAFDKRYTEPDIRNKSLDPYGYYGWRMQDYITLIGVRNYEKAFEVQQLVNEARRAEGLDPLVMDETLTEYAMRRSAELAVLYSHTRPDGSAFYSLMNGSLYAENAAEYQVTPAEVMDAWMNSQGHHDNIMTKSYRTIGVGCFELEGRCYWIQWFGKGSTQTDMQKPANATVRERIGYAADLFGDAPNTSDVIFWFGKEPEYSYRLETEQTALQLEVRDRQVVPVYLRGCCEDANGTHWNARIAYGADQLVWSVADPNVASVENGIVTAKANGSTTVTARTKNGHYALDVHVTVGRAAIDTVTFAPDALQYRGDTPYVIANGRAHTPQVVVTDTDGNTVDASRYTVTYRSNVDPGTAYVDVASNDGEETKTLWFKIYLPPTSDTSVVNTAICPVIRWEPVEGAKGYVIYRRAWNLKSNGWTTFERWNNTTDTFFCDAKVYAGTRYQYGVKAYFEDPMDNYNLGVVGPLKTIVFVTQRSLRSVTAGKRQLTVKWGASKVFTGYQVQIATNPAFTQNSRTVAVSNPAKASLTVKGLKSGTTCYVRVRSYQTFEGMTYYGAWSDTLSCRVR